jgi:hypothetical protein
LYPDLKPPAFLCSSGNTSGCMAKVVFEPTQMLLDWLCCFNSGAECARMSVVIWLATMSVVTFFKSGYTALLILGFPESRGAIHLRQQRSTPCCGKCHRDIHHNTPESRLIAA